MARSMTVPAALYGLLAGGKTRAILEELLLASSTGEQTWGGKK